MLSVFLATVGSGRMRFRVDKLANPILNRPPFKFAGLWLTLGWILILAVVLLSLWPRPPQFIKFMHGDKLGHISSYLILMFWFGNIYFGKRQRLWLGIAFITMGVLLEILQGVGSYRGFEFADMLANSLGVALGWSLARTRLSNCLLVLDAWFLRSSSSS